MSKEEIIWAVAISQLNNIIWLVALKLFPKKNPIEKFKNMRITKILGFIFSYIVPIGIIASILIFKIEMTALNILVLTFSICNIFFNLILGLTLNAISLSNDSIKLSGSVFEKLKESDRINDETFTKIHNHIEYLKR